MEERGSMRDFLFVQILQSVVCRVNLHNALLNCQFLWFRSIDKLCLGATGVIVFQCYIECFHLIHLYYLEKDDNASFDITPFYNTFFCSLCISNVCWGVKDLRYQQVLFASKFYICICILFVHNDIFPTIKGTYWGKN